MKKILFFISFIMLFVSTLTSVTSCGKDDDKEDIANNIPLSEYILGSWRTYQVAYYGTNGKSAFYDVDKTGAFSSVYFELNFAKDGSLTFAGWKPDSQGINHWEEYKCTYTVKNDMVTVYDPTDNTSVSMVYNAKDHTLCLTGSTTSNGIVVTYNLLARKG